MSDADNLSGLGDDPTDKARDLRDAELEARIRTDGARWRDALPPTEALLAGVRQLSAMPHPPPPLFDSREDTRVSNRISAHQAAFSSGPAALHTPRIGVRGVLAVLAALAIVAGFLGVLYSNHPSAGGSTPVSSPAHHATPTPSPTVVPQNAWVQPPALSQLDAIPILAPSDARVIYLGGPHLRRSSDSGATWQTLPLPSDFPANSGYNWDDVFVSPTSANTVFATAHVQVGATCPTLTKQSAHIGAQMLLGGSVPCDLQWVSQNGGQTWKPINVTISGRLLGSADALRHVSSTFSNAPQAQGSTLYSLAGYGPDAGFPGFRIVKSTDNGVTWSAVDAQLNQAGLNICDYAADSATKTLYAVASSQACSWDQPPPIVLWASTDGGAHWSRVTLPAQGLEEYMLVTSGTLYLAIAVTSGQEHVGGGTLGATNFFASKDGGHTWKTSPATGVVSGQFANSGTMAALGDGIVVPFLNSDGTAVPLYAWSFSAQRWNLVTTAPVNNTLYLRAYRHVAGSTSEDIWLAYMGITNNTEVYALIEYVP